MNWNRIFVRIIFSVLFILPLVSLGQQKLARQKASIHYITIEPKVQIGVTNWGGKGSPMVFIPSWHATAHVYDDFAPRFNDEHGVYVIDIRGHGESSRPEHGYQLDTLTSDILTVLDSLKLDQVILLGLSRSSSIISHFAAKYPNRVNKLIYLSGPIDRAFARTYIHQEDVTKRLIVFDSLEAVCDPMTKYSLKPLLPENWIESKPDTIGKEWRRNDPPPPYSKISAKALAFWHTPVTLEELMKEYHDQCGIDSQNGTNKILLDYYEIQKAIDDHNMELFQKELKKGEYVMIEGAYYYPFAVHPDLVETKIREFIKMD